MIIAIYLLMEKKYKADNKNVNFPTQVCLGSIYVYFSVNIDAIHKSEIFNIHKYFS